MSWLILHVIASQTILVMGKVPNGGIASIAQQSFIHIVATLLQHAIRFVNWSVSWRLQSGAGWLRDPDSSRLPEQSARADKNCDQSSIINRLFLVNFR